MAVRGPFFSDNKWGWSFVSLPNHHRKHHCKRQLMTHEEKVQEVMDALVAEARWPADGLSLVTQQDVLLCDDK